MINPAELPKGRTYVNIWVYDELTRDFLSSKLVRDGVNLDNGPTPGRCYFFEKADIGGWNGKPTIIKQLVDREQGRYIVTSTYSDAILRHRPETIKPVIWHGFFDSS